MEYKVTDNTYGIADFQTKLLEILHEFIAICKRYNLRWWGCGGTCIGALRHNGFIPWDDDLDIGMPRPDYEKLWSLRDEINKEGHYILTRTTDNKNYHHRVIQFMDTNTTFIHSRSENEDIEHGIYIDIIPMDACAPTKLGYYRQVFNAILFSIYNVQCLSEYNKKKSINIATSIALKLIKSKKIRYHIWKHCENQMTKYNWETAKQIIQITCDLTSMTHPYKAEWFRSVKTHQFEDIEINLPIGVEHYLSLCYKDFMQYPPEQLRHPIHNTKLIDFNTPFSAYKGKYYCIKDEETPT